MLNDQLVFHVIITKTATLEHQIEYDSFGKVRHNSRIDQASGVCKAYYL